MKKKVNVPDTVTTWPLLIDRLFVSILRGESFVSTFEVRIDFLISKIEYGRYGLVPSWISAIKFVSVLLLYLPIDELEKKEIVFDESDRVSNEDRIPRTSLIEFNGFFFLFLAKRSPHASLDI